MKFNLDYIGYLNKEYYLKLLRLLLYFIILYRCTITFSKHFELFSSYFKCIQTYNNFIHTYGGTIGTDSLKSKVNVSMLQK